MEKIRVLVVDDSLVIRRALKECFRSDPEIEVVGVAEDGLKALMQIDTLKPDVVTLDIEMPNMDGLETLRTIRDKGSKVPVIMFSKYTSEGAVASIEAMELGASDVVAKPMAHGGEEDGCYAVKRQLTTRIRALGRRARKARKEREEGGRGPEPLVAHSVGPFRLVSEVSAIGFAVSTGGPVALIEVVAALNPSINVPIFITQHMPEMFTKVMAERLAARGALPVFEAQAGMVVKPGHIYVAPGNYHLEVSPQGGALALVTSQGPRENSCRPSADVMFRSLSQVYGAGLLSIVMTGMGQDGKKGCEVVKERGGIVIAQDESSSLVWGMPRAIVAASLHDAVVPLSGIAPLINASCSQQKEKK